MRRGQPNNHIHPCSSNVFKRTYIESLLLVALGNHYDVSKTTFRVNIGHTVHDPTNRAVSTVPYRPVEVGLLIWQSYELWSLGSSALGRTDRFRPYLRWLLRGYLLKVAYFLQLAIFYFMKIFPSALSFAAKFCVVGKGQLENLLIEIVHYYSNQRLSGIFHSALSNFSRWCNGHYLSPTVTLLPSGATTYIYY